MVIYYDTHEKLYADDYRTFYMKNDKNEMFYFDWSKQSLTRDSLKTIYNNDRFIPIDDLNRLNTSNNRGLYFMVLKDNFYEEVLRDTDS